MRVVAAGERLNSRKQQQLITTENSMDRVKGKVAIVTGGAAGVGRESALLLAAEGAQVVITDIDEEGGRALAKEIGDAALFMRHDISSEQDWIAVMAAATERFGPVHVLVNNAGICIMASIEETTLELWQKLHRINADGTFLGCKYGIAEMKKSGHGSIINVSSTAALSGMSTLCAYSGSKGSVTALTRSIASYCNKNAYRIRCNSIHPGGIATQMTSEVRGSIDAMQASFDTNPQSGFCDPRDVANMVLFLASDESRYINGAEMRIDNALLVALV